MIVDTPSSERIRLLRERMALLARGRSDAELDDHMPQAPPFEKRELLDADPPEVFHVVYSASRAKFDAGRTCVQQAAPGAGTLAVEIEDAQDREKTVVTPCPLCQQHDLFECWFAGADEAIRVGPDHHLVHKRHRIFDDECLLVSNDCRPATCTTAADLAAMVSVARETAMDVYFSSIFGGASVPHHWHCQLSPQPFSSLDFGKAIPCCGRTDVQLYLGSLCGLRFDSSADSSVAIIERITSAIDAALPRYAQDDGSATIGLPSHSTDYGLPWPGYNLLVHGPHIYFFPRRAEYFWIRNVPDTGNVRFRMGGSEVAGIFALGPVEAFRNFTADHCAKATQLTCLKTATEIAPLIRFVEC